MRFRLHRHFGGLSAFLSPAPGWFLLCFGLPQPSPALVKTLSHLDRPPPDTHRNWKFMQRLGTAWCTHSMYYKCRRPWVMMGAEDSSSWGMFWVPFLCQSNYSFRLSWSRRRRDWRSSRCRRPLRSAAHRIRWKPPCTSLPPPKGHGFSTIPMVLWR